MYFNRAGIIQDNRNRPVLFHISRHSNDKKILHPLLNNAENLPKLIYSDAISSKDERRRDRDNSSLYWWLVDNIDFEEIRARTRKK